MQHNLIQVLKILEADGNSEQENCRNVPLLRDIEQIYRERYCDTEPERISRIGGRPILNMQTLVAHRMFEEMGFRNVSVSDYVCAVNRKRKERGLPSIDIAMTDPTDDEVMRLKKRLFYELIPDRTPLCEDQVGSV